MGDEYDAIFGNKGIPKKHVLELKRKVICGFSVFYGLSFLCR